MFGVGGFGFDSATGVGLGLGELGVGGLGTDDAVWRWESRGLEAGAHTVSVAAVDCAGVVVATSLPGTEVKIDRLPVAARGIGVDTGFVLQWEV